jgi:hypothetical protein
MDTGRRRRSAMGVLLGGTVCVSLAVCYLIGLQAQPGMGPPGVALERTLPNCTAFAIDRDTGHAVAAPCAPVGGAVLTASLGLRPATGPAAPWNAE